MPTDFLTDLAAQCPPETPFQFLRFTWFGDFACSGGPHYYPGTALPFETIMQRVDKGHSDDLVENLACWVLRPQVPPDPSAPAWKALWEKFYALIRENYMAHPIRYSPDYPLLLAADSPAEYLKVIAAHTNCGGAMRSAALAYGDATAHEHLTLVGMTHLYPESLAGAEALYAAVRVLKKGGSCADMWDGALTAARQGEDRALEWIRKWTGKTAARGRMVDWMQAVQAHQDARHGIRDWHGEGITTRFVVSAALQIATEAIPLGPARALRHVVEQGIGIGGDPDTLGSMGMALIGTHFGDALQAEIDRVVTDLVPPERFDLPAFLRRSK